MTDQEARDELARLIDPLIFVGPDWRDAYDERHRNEGFVREQGAYACADAILAAGYRKHPEPEWEYSAGYEGDSPTGRKWFALDSEYWIREAAESVVARYEDPQVKLVRRTKPGPWGPVPTSEGEATKIDESTP